MKFFMRTFGRLRLFFVVILFAVYNVLSAQEVDVLDATTIPGLGESYAPVTYTSAESGVTYAGVLSKLGDSAVKFKYEKGSAYGLISTVSTRRVTEVRISWFAHASKGEKLSIYANVQPYTKIENLFQSNTVGTKIVTLEFDGDMMEHVVPIDGDYKYIGICADSNTKSVVDISSITITYAASDDSGLKEQTIYFTPTVATYDLNNSSEFKKPELKGDYETAITYKSSDESVATVGIDGTITANKVGVTVITATAAETDEYKSVSASYQLTVIDSKTIKGAYALVAEKNGIYYAMSTTSTNDKKGLQSVEVVPIQGRLLNVDENIDKIQWNITNDNSTSTISPVSLPDKYLYADLENTETKLSLSTTRCVWTIDAEHNSWSNSSGTRTFYYVISEKCFSYRSKTNVGLGDNFSNYTTPMPIVPGYTRATSVGKIGTICLPCSVKVDDYVGAEFYSIVCKKVDATNKPVSIICEKVDVLVAGMPYLFVGNAESLRIAYSGDSKDAANHNGLYGTLTKDTPVAEGHYLVSNNKIVKCGKNCYIQANRAYINMEEVPAISNDNSVSGKRFLEIFGEGTVGIDNVEADENVDVYSINGILLKRNVASSLATDGLPHGVYIINGQKVVVK